MNVQPPVINPREVLRILLTYRRQWIVPAIVGTLLAGAYIAVRTPIWEASQALALRNEAANNTEGPGRFRQPEDMKVTQETLLEIAKSQQVLSAALDDAGTPLGTPAIAATRKDLVELRDAIVLVPPDGAEFGKTEIVYLKVTANDRERALRLIAAICKHTQLGLQQLRQAKAQSMIDELGKAAALAQHDLRASTRQLGDMEREVGSDLAELRMLEMVGTGDSDLRRELTQIDNELRETETTQRSNQEMIALLRLAKDDAGQFLATPNKLLESQPALRRLKEGLVDAQLHTAQLLGTMTDSHPLVINARLIQQEVSQRLHNELDLAIRGVELDLRLSVGRREMLNQQAANIRRRLDRLAGMRAEYSMLASDTRQRTALLDKAHKDLADARASQAGAGASLVCTVDLPEIGDRPVGPSNAVITLWGCLGGLCTGFGLVFLMAPPQIMPMHEAAPASEFARDRHAIGSRQPPPRQVLSLNDALLTLAQPNTRVRRRA